MSPFESPTGTTSLNRNVLQEHYGCPDDCAVPILAAGPSDPAGYFRLGQDTLGYGQLRCVNHLSRRPSLVPAEAPLIDDDFLHAGLPFDPAEVLDNLRFERYLNAGNGANTQAANSAVRAAYYLLRPLLPVAVRKHVQRLHLRNWDRIPFPRWPVDCSVEMLLEKLLFVVLKRGPVERVPFIWFWPEGHAAALLMTHDIETAAGRDFCPVLIEMNREFGLRGAFQVIPEQRYPVTTSFLDELRAAGAEINVHDLNHDGHLYDNRREFLRRVVKINEYGRAFNAGGFRAGVLYRNLSWYDSLDFRYDMSVPNVAHLDPQRGGCCTVFPFYVGRILELPLTTTQDYTLFHIFNDYSLDLWKKQIELVVSRNGLVSFNIHPDYVIQRRARETYSRLLATLARIREDANLWVTLPAEVDSWWRARQQMRLIADGNTWRVEGRESERARVAFASLDGDRVSYEFAKPN